MKTSAAAKQQNDWQSYVPACLNEYIVDTKTDYSIIMKQLNIKSKGTVSSIRSNSKPYSLEIAMMILEICGKTEDEKRWYYESRSMLDYDLYKSKKLLCQHTPSLLLLTDIDTYLAYVMLCDNGKLSDFTPYGKRVEQNFEALVNDGYIEYVDGAYRTTDKQVCLDELTTLKLMSKLSDYVYNLKIASKSNSHGALETTLLTSENEKKFVEFTAKQNLEALKFMNELEKNQNKDDVKTSAVSYMQLTNVAKLCLALLLMTVTFIHTQKIEAGVGGIITPDIDTTVRIETEIENATTTTEPAEVTN